MTQQMTQTKFSLGSAASFLKKYAIWVLFVLLVLIPALTNPDFRSMANLQGFLQSSVVLIILTMGEMFALLVAGVDLAVGAALALGSVTLAMASNAKFGLPVAILITVAAVTITGILNGLAVAYLRLPSFIVTFGMMALEQGAALILSGGNRVDLPFDSSLPSFIYNSFLQIPYGIWVVIVLLIIGSLVMHYVRPFRHLYAVGSNLSAARLSGVHVRFVIVLAFACSALFAGIGAVFYTARIVSGDPIAGGNLNLEAIAAAVIGGVSLFGGKGNLVGAILGAVVFSLISNVLTLYGVNPNIAELIGGIILVGAAYANVANDKSKG